MTAVVIDGRDFRVVDDCNDNCERMQRELGGYFEILCRGKSDFEGFANEEGMLIPLPANAIGYEVARRLGFDMSSFPQPFIFGPLLITSMQELESLTSADIARIRGLFDEVVGSCE